jgi:acyl-CoA synthetase (AMP-forming)/AMP-acid ligase II
VTRHQDNQARTVVDLLKAGPDEQSALEALGNKPLSFKSLRSLVGATVARLNRHGVGRRERVAIVLNNGPEMAACFLAVAAGTAAAPLNPAYKHEEFEFYLSDLEPKILVIEDGQASPATEVAARLGIPVVRLKADPEQGAGYFTLLFEDEVSNTEAVRPGTGGADDIALLLHTSGTTSRPKLVPLHHSNLCASAYNIATTLRFTEHDRGLNIMPLFHIHGLVAGILAPLSAGGCVVCSRGFNALKFFSWITEATPTWYSAVPTMHQAILARAAKNPGIINANPLRFIRSSSSSIPPQVIREIEKTFGCPLIESYGMTEASHQMASNPLPPGLRKLGSVGLSAGPEIAIADENGKRLGPGETGEIVIRGENVMNGYVNNEAANAEAFTSEGYFRTGDQGVIDADGYLSITGRLKEIINRGGEKVSPREIDEVLMDHPCVAQCVCFALPHPKLGEDVAVAIVLREATSADEHSIKEFCATRLAKFKVPQRIYFLEEIPKGATGKLQRIGLAAKLGLM